jgi:hypothetical protein
MLLVTSSPASVRWMPVIGIGCSTVFACASLFLIQTGFLTWRSILVLAVVLLFLAARCLWLARTVRRDGETLLCRVPLLKARRLAAADCVLALGSWTFVGWVIAYLRKDGAELSRHLVLRERATKREFFLGYVPCLFGAQNAVSSVAKVLGVPADDALAAALQPKAVPAVQGPNEPPSQRGTSAAMKTAKHASAPSDLPMVRGDRRSMTAA